jgi:galactose mutarotase-like enzyme
MEFMWQADQQVWARHAPVLFPIVGKLKDNSFVFDNSTFRLGQHGFARDLDFVLVEQNDAFCVFELRSSEETKKSYPFDFVFQVKYVLEGSTLVTEYTVKNPSDKPLIFAVGAHPGFNCPLADGEVLEDYYLEFENETFYTTELSNGLRSDAKKELILNNNKLFLTKHLFDKDALVFENGQISRISLCSSVSSHKITMECANWPYFGIWAKPGQPFVCLEPWYGIADKETATGQLTDKDGMISLEPQKTFSCSFSTSFV